MSSSSTPPSGYKPLPSAPPQERITFLPTKAELSFKISQATVVRDNLAGRVEALKKPIKKEGMIIVGFILVGMVVAMVCMALAWPTGVVGLGTVLGYIALGGGVLCLLQGVVVELRIQWSNWFNPEKKELNSLLQQVNEFLQKLQNSQEGRAEVPLTDKEGTLFNNLSNIVRELKDTNTIELLKSDLVPQKKFLK